MFVARRLCRIAAATSPSSSSMVSVARSTAATLRAPTRLRLYSAAAHSTGPDYGTVEKFESQWVDHFDKAEDLFEVQRGLNHCFGYDIVPTAAIVEAALKSCRRHNCLPTAVRIFEGLKDKIGNDKQYKEYEDYFRPMLEEMGVPTPAEMGIWTRPKNVKDHIKSPFEPGY